MIMKIIMVMMVMMMIMLIMMTCIPRPFQVRVHDTHFLL